MKANGPRYVRRAHRYLLASWILYRPAGEVRWREGRAENISESGVLFHGAEPLDVEARIEVMVDLPGRVLGTAGGASIGRGRIVRRQAERSDSRPALAAAISEWEMVKSDPGKG